MYLLLTKLSIGSIVKKTTKKNKNYYAHLQMGVMIRAILVCNVTGNQGRINQYASCDMAWCRPPAQEGPSWRSNFFYISITIINDECHCDCMSHSNG